MFSSTIVGSTFTCAVDGAPAAACSSPFRKRLGYGSHSVVITTFSPAGIADPTPAVVAFKITRPRR
jgi:hypothetical protein